MQCEKCGGRDDVVKITLRGQAMIICGKCTVETCKRCNAKLTIDDAAGPCYLCNETFSCSRCNHEVEQVYSCFNCKAHLIGCNGPRCARAAGAHVTARMFPCAFDPSHVKFCHHGWFGETGQKFILGGPGTVCRKAAISMFAMHVFSSSAEPRLKSNALSISKRGLQRPCY